MMAKRHGNKRIPEGELKRLREAGMLNEEIAEQLGCSTSSVVKLAQAMGLPSRARGPLRQVDVKLLYKLWHSEIPYADVALALGVCASTLYALRIKHGLGPRPRYLKEPDNDPTPSEIEQRARECRERHYAQRRGETDETTLQWRNGGAA